MRAAALVALGGALGSLVRWGLSGTVQKWSGATFPWGTFAVNGLGSLAIGWVTALALERALVPPDTRAFLVPGVLGGFTTFSAYSYETLALIRNGQWSSAAGYALGSLAVGVIAAGVGYALGSRS